MSEERIIELFEKNLKINEEILTDLRKLTACLVPGKESDAPLSSDNDPKLYNVLKLGNMIVFKPGQEWLDDQEVMQLLKISSRTLRRRRAKKVFPFKKQEGKFYYKLSDLFQDTKKPK